MKIDLHCHTTISDGIYTPSELIKYAKKCNINVIAITDHDAVDGIEEGLQAAAKEDVIVIPGIEFSVDHIKDHGAFHIVGLYIDHSCQNLRDEIRNLQNYRDKRLVLILDDLRKHNIDLDIDEVVQMAGAGAAGKPHVARVMVKHGIENSVEDIFKQYLADGKPGDVPKKRISPERAIELIIEAGGIAIIAHPDSLELDSFSEFEDFLKPLIDKGLVGIEAYAAMHKEESIQQYKNIASKYNLLLSGGSDFHGDKGEEMGFYNEGHLIPEELYTKISKFYQTVRVN